MHSSHIALMLLASPDNSYVVSQLAMEQLMFQSLYFVVHFDPSLHIPSFLL